jgi:hypothetical protein
MKLLRILSFILKIRSNKMEVQIYTTNHNGKIEFTKSELETLLNKMYANGYEAGKRDHAQIPSYTETPSVVPYGVEPVCNETVKKETVVEPKTFELKTNGPVDPKVINELFGSFFPGNIERPNDVFTNLAKELGLR